MWGCAGTTEINRLQKLQKRAARLAIDSSFEKPSLQLIKKLRWKTINELIEYESKTMVFKSPNELAPQYLRNLFTKNSQCATHNLRNTLTDLRLPKRKTSAGQRCFSSRGAQFWNSLSADCNQATSLKIFKSCLNHFLLLICSLSIIISFNCNQKYF